jgi:HEAT repeat protein
LEVVRPLLEHDNSVVRAHAATVLGKIGIAADGVALAAAVSDESPWVAIRAATALRQLGQIDTLHDLSRSGDISSVAALEALAEGAS